MTPISPETPVEGPRVVRYAGFWRRYAASGIDGLVTAGIPIAFYVIVVLIAGDGMSAHERKETFRPLAKAVWLVIIVGSWLYSAFMLSSRHRATLGKMALGLCVTDLQGNRISFARATGRHFAKILSTIIFCVGYLMAAFGEEKQAMHDRIAGTLVLFVAPDRSNVAPNIAVNLNAKM